MSKQYVWNMNYQARPIHVDAFQITKATRGDNKDWPEWLNYAWQMDTGAGSVGCVDFPDSDGKDQLCVTDQHGGRQIVPWDGWIVNMDNQVGGYLTVESDADFRANTLTWLRPG